MERPAKMLLASIKTCEEINLEHVLAIIQRCPDTKDTFLENLLQTAVEGEFLDIDPDLTASTDKEVGDMSIIEKAAYTAGKRAEIKAHSLAEKIKSGEKSLLPSFVTENSFCEICDHILQGSIIMRLANLAREDRDLKMGPGHKIFVQHSDGTGCGDCANCTGCGCGHQ